MSLGGESFRAKGGLRKAERSRGKRWRGAGTLNLVSLMDIFTILVFFLLVNSSDVETISGKSSVKLPESISTKKPSETLVLVVDNEYLVLQGKSLISIEELSKQKDPLIPSLKQELAFQYQKLYGNGGGKGDAETGSVTIMGDKTIPYRLLKKIMMTCAEANFGNISLAVQQKTIGDA